MAAIREKPDSAANPGQRTIDPGWMMAELLPCLRIAHQVSGRVRLKLADTVPDLTALRTGGEALRQALGTLPGVRGIQLNPLARSCVVEYDCAVIPDVAWPDLLAGRQTPAATGLAGLLSAAAPRSPRTTRRKEKTP